MEAGINASQTKEARYYFFVGCLFFAGDAHSVRMESDVVRRRVETCQVDTVHYAY